MTGITWVFASNSHLVENKIECGKEKSGTPVYVARAKYPQTTEHPVGVYPGKQSDNIKDKGGVAIGVEGKEIELTDPSHFQIATAQADAYKWVSYSGKFKPKNLNGVPIRAGYETSGAGYELAIYYIARANITIEGKDYGVACGKVFEGSEAKIPYGGKDCLVGKYDVLVYDN